MGVLLASSTTVTGTTYGANDSNRQAFVMSDGRRLAIYGTGTLSYQTSADGVTWSTAATIAGTNGTNQHVAAMVQVGNTIYVFQVGSAGNVIVCTYNTGTQLLTVSTPSLPSALTTLLTGATSLVAGYDSTNTRFYVASGNGSVLGVCACPTSFATAIALTAGSGHGGVQQPTGPGLATRDIAVIPGATASILVTTIQTTGVLVIPLTFDGTSFAAGSGELVAGGTIESAAAALDASNLLDVVWMTSAGQVMTAKRTGTAVYSTAQTIGASGNTSAPALSLTTNSGDLQVYYSSLAGQSNGEIYVASRKSGTWTQGVLFAGGDSSGYTLPRSSAAVSSNRADVLYQRGTAVYYAGNSGGSAPDTPVISAPSGNETSLTPTITAPYTNSAAPTDTQSAFEDQVKQGATVVWDSGKVTSTATSNVYGTNSNTGDSNYVAPGTLVYGTAYTVSRRYWDSILSPAQPSGWSTPVSFTPIQGGTATITSLSDNSIVVSSTPGTIQSPTFDSITASWTHPTSNAANAYQDTLYANDGVTVVAQTGVTTITGNLASGSSYTSSSWAVSGLSNGATYKLTRKYRDAVTGLWAESAQWTLTASWAGPAAPTGFAATAHPDLGTIVLTWTNPGTAASVIVQRSPTGANLWTTLASGNLIATLTDYAPLMTGFDYQVIAVNSLGIEGTAATASDVTLAANGAFGVCLVDSVNTAVVCWLGGITDWKQSTTFDDLNDVLTVVPLGSDTPIKSKRRMNYSSSKQREYAVFPTGPYGYNGTVIDQGITIATLRAMSLAYNPLWYRDVNGEAFYVQIENVERSSAQDGFPLRRVQFDMDQINSTAAPLTA